MNKLYFFLLMSLLSFLISCGDEIQKEEKKPTAQTKKDEVNDFIWSALNSWYYWQKDVPNLADNRFSDTEYLKFINSTKDHEGFFYNLLYRYGEEDRFSWVVDDVEKLMASFSGKQAATGLEYSLTSIENGNRILGLVNYIIPNSPADKAGLKRGDVFFKINGELLTQRNYRKLTEDNFTITVAQNFKIKNRVFTYDDEKIFHIKGEELQENPIHYSKIFKINGKKIAYLVFNAFQANYNDELNEKFGEFKAEGVTDLILDLRYNGGGSVNTALALGQMITGQFANRKYITLNYNDKHKASNSTGYLNKEIGLFEFEDGEMKSKGKELANSLHLNRVYVLTSHATASASELTITSLKPYIDVVQIGQKTYGKFVGSITLVDAPDKNINKAYTDFENRNKNHSYGMQPIVFAYFNSRNEIFVEGVEPDIKINFVDYLGNIKEFGNPSDPALAKALEQITGNKFRKASEKKLKLETWPVGDSKTLKKFGTEMYITDLSEFK